MESRATHGPADRILAVADTLFYTQGFAATGINQLIAEAKVAKDSFYRHFPAKNDLVVAYLRNRLDAFAEGLGQAIESHDQPAARLLAVFDFTETWLETTRFRGCAFQNSVGEFPDPASPPRRVVAEAKQTQRDLLAQLCEAAGCGERGDEAFLLLEGALTQAAVTQTLWPIQGARAAVERWLAAAHDSTAQDSTAS